jgi:hypothetical protein
MKYDVELSARSRHHGRPCVGAFGLRVLHEVEDLDLAGPHRLVSVLLVNRNAFYPRCFAALNVANCVEQSGESGIVHAVEV